MDYNATPPNLSKIRIVRRIIGELENLCKCIDSLSPSSPDERDKLIANQELFGEIMNDRLQVFEGAVGDFARCQTMYANWFIIKKNFLHPKVCELRDSIFGINKLTARLLENRSPVSTDVTTNRLAFETEK